MTSVVGNSKATVGVGDTACESGTWWRASTNIMVKQIPINNQLSWVTTTWLVPSFKT